MAESTLSIQWKEIQARLGLFLGWGRGALYGDTAWTGQQQFELDGFTASGLRRFYFPEPLPGESVPHKWSFLRPVARLDLPAGTTAPQSVLLPDDFGGVEGQLTVATTTANSQPWQIEWTNDTILLERYSLFPQMTGPPMMACVLPLKGTSGTAGQRFQLLVFPMADQDYTLQVTYYIHPDYLSTAFPFAYGGAAHAETILESCLSVAEERLDDIPAMQGSHGQAFMRRLQASVAADRSMKPQRLGYNGDRSDERDAGTWNPHYWASAATYNGQPFG